MLSASRMRSWAAGGSLLRFLHRASKVQAALQRLAKLPRRQHDPTVAERYDYHSFVAHLAITATSSPDEAVATAASFVAELKAPLRCGS